MAELVNVFSWSRSRGGMFKECRRRYYYHYYGSWGGWAADAAPGKKRGRNSVSRTVQNGCLGFMSRLL